MTKDGQQASPEPATVQRQVHEPRERAGRREPPTELDWTHAEYVPLPPSPPTWEVDGRDEFNRLYRDPVTGPLLRAGFGQQHTKVVKLAAALSPEQRQGTVGAAVAHAYRKLVLQRVKAGQLVAAATRCLEMFEQVPGDVQDVDKRRFNRILAQMDKLGRRHGFTPIAATSPRAEPLFTVSDGSGWTLDAKRKLSSAEQPDQAFSVVASGAEGTWLLARRDDAGPGARAVLRRLNRVGEQVAERALDHDVYRTGTAATGLNFAIMDSSGALHIYDAGLNLVVMTSLREDSRVLEHFRSIETDYWGEFKSQVRAVDVAPEGERYLFTLADEAWCCTLQGRALWGAAMPLKEGWKRVVGRSARVGVASEVDAALHLLGLTLPVSPVDIKRQYRRLAVAHHPDRNPGDTSAVERMKALNLAFEILTGVDPAALEFEEFATTSFVRTTPGTVFEVAGLRLHLNMPGENPQDWVYAASFTGTSGGAYVATYSGKVILLSREGKAVTVYDIGTCPCEIVDNGRYAYFLTPTRLYVVEDGNKLAAFLDVFHQGRLIVAPSGFGLLTSNRLQWFTADGRKVGELLSRNPIRAVHAGDGCALVKTRQHQVVVRGLVL